MALRMKHHLGAAMSDLRYEPVPFRTRARLADSVVVDTWTAMLVWEPRRIVPVYAVPLVDIRGHVVPRSRSHRRPTWRASRRCWARATSASTPAPGWSSTSKWTG
ncbi:hypothetical protein [Actinokineospora alba]|uniref:hypothetical protein n=1 Tax=Actinokineospora alba TaxID=504798 RepID=UPI001E633D2A|nr:hypothetical protein [Actinokineospora alba]